MQVACIREDQKTDRVERFRKLLLPALPRAWSTKQHLLLVLEALVFLEDDTTSKVLCPVHIRRISDSDELFSVLFLDVVEVGLVRPGLVRVESWLVAESWHRKEVLLPEIEGVRDGEVKRAIAQVIIVVLVLIDGLHQRHGVADAACHLVKHQARALVQYKHSLAILRAEPTDLASDHQHSIHCDVLLVEVQFRDDFSVHHSLCRPDSVRDLQLEALALHLETHTLLEARLCALDSSLLRFTVLCVVAGDTGVPHRYDLHGEELI